MVHGYGADAKWFATLTEIDDVFAEKVRAAGCGDCGGPLDRADYDRKPRGDLGEAVEAYRRRRSFCCRREGCRHRATPPSVRFLGRKVYIAAIVVIASMLGRQQTLVGRDAPRQVQGVPVRTVRRWLAFWSITFALTTFWTEARAFLASPVDEAMLPGSLLARFGVTTEATTLTRMLRWIAPITTSSVRAEIAMPV